MAHKDATTVRPPPPSDNSCGQSKSDDTDLDTTTGSHSAGAQIDLADVVCLYAPKCGRVLINLPDSTGVVFNVEAADGLPSVVYESVGRIVGHRSSLRITIGEA